MAGGSDANAAAGVGAPPNIQIRVIECKEAWFLDGGLREYPGLPPSPKEVLPRQES